MAEAEDRVVMWRSQKVEDMTREELMEAFQQVCRMYRGALLEHGRQLDVLSSFRAARL